MIKKFNPFPVLMTQRLTLRQLSADDAQVLFNYQSDKDNFPHVDMPVYKELSEAEAYIEKMNKGVEENKWIIWMICEAQTGAAVGTISIWNLDDKENKAEFGYGVFPEFRRKGYMREAIEAATQYGFEEMRLEILEAYTSHYNQVSIDFLDKLGFNFIETIEDSYSPHSLMDVFLKRNPHQRIRLAEARDIKDVSKLIQEVLVDSNAADYPEQVIQFMCSYYSEETIASKFDTKKTWLLETYQANGPMKLTGTISLCDKEIQALFIDTNTQKGGYGRALLETAEGYAKASGVDTLHLSASLTAKIFYEKMGYKHIKLEDDENFGKAYLMEKDL